MNEIVSFIHSIINTHLYVWHASHCFSVLFSVKNFDFDRKKNKKKELHPSNEFITIIHSWRCRSFFFFISQIEMKTNAADQMHVCVCSCVCVFILQWVSSKYVNRMHGKVSIWHPKCVLYTLNSFCHFSKRENCIDRLTADSNWVEIAIVNVLETRFHKCWSSLAPIFQHTDLVKICISLDWCCFFLLLLLLLLLFCHTFLDERPAKRNLWSKSEKENQFRSL